MLDNGERRLSVFRLHKKCLYQFDDDMNLLCYRYTVIALLTFVSSLWQLVVHLMSISW